MVYAMPAIVTRWLTMSYILTYLNDWLNPWFQKSFTGNILFMIPNCGRGGEGSRLRKNSYIFTFFGERPFWYVFWNGFWIRKEYWPHYFSLETQIWINVFLDSWVRGGVNIFLPVFKSLKFFLQYEILNLDFFCK